MFLGEGSHTDAEGNIRDGKWRKGEPMDGEWCIQFHTGSKYTGQCVLGRPHGIGTCKYLNGDVYSGHWVHGLRSGQGICVFANGEAFDGDWEHNHVSLTGKGTLTLSNGTVHKYVK